MGIWDRLKQELVDIVQFLDDTNNTLVYRFERFQNEIKYGAKLVVREGQAAVFINEGRLADVFLPGTYTLETKNLPILGTLKGWKYGFESPFKAEVYFVSTRQFTDLKWGTMNPIMVRDPEFGPVRLRAFGTYTMRVKEPGIFIKEIVGTDNRFTTEEIVAQLRNVIVAEFADAIGENRIPMLDLAANQKEISDLIATKMRPDLEQMGIELPRLLIENISLPPEVEGALDSRSKMGVLGDLNAYAKLQAADAMRDAAKNPGGAGAVMAMGMGGMMGNVMGQAAYAGGAAPGNAGPGSPPPLPTNPPLFLAIDGKQVGPFELNMVAMKARSGELLPTTLVWRQGMEGWKPATEVADLALMFAPAPPGPPPIPR